MSHERLQGSQTSFSAGWWRRNGAAQRLLLEVHRLHLFPVQAELEGTGAKIEESIDFTPFFLLNKYWFSSFYAVTFQNAHSFVKL